MDSFTLTRVQITKLLGLIRNEYPSEIFIRTILDSIFEFKRCFGPNLLTQDWQAAFFELNLPVLNTRSVPITDVCIYVYDVSVFACRRPRVQTWHVSVVLACKRRRRIYDDNS